MTKKKYSNYKVAIVLEFWGSKNSRSIRTYAMFSTRCKSYKDGGWRNFSKKVICEWLRKRGIYSPIWRRVVTYKISYGCKFIVPKEIVFIYDEMDYKFVKIR